MKNNFDLYLDLRKEFRTVLSNINFINVCDEWDECKYLCPNTREYYDMILKCECFQAGFINIYQYKNLSKLLNLLYFHFEENYLLNIYEKREDIEIKKSLDFAKESLEDFKELLSISFQGYHDFSF